MQPTRISLTVVREALPIGHEPPLSMVFVSNSRSSMKSFNELRQKMTAEHRKIVQRRYYTVTDEKADEATLDNLISTGQSETFLRKAIQEQVRGHVMDTVLEIQEIERDLKELHQVFMDMAVLVAHQGAPLDTIEDHVNRANSYVTHGTVQLNEVWKKQKNTRKWTCFVILLLLIIIANSPSSSCPLDLGSINLHSALQYLYLCYVIRFLIICSYLWVRLLFSGLIRVHTIVIY